MLDYLGCSLGVGWPNWAMDHFWNSWTFLHRFTWPHLWMACCLPACDVLYQRTYWWHLRASLMTAFSGGEGHSPTMHMIAITGLASREAASLICLEVGGNQASEKCTTCGRIGHAGMDSTTLIVDKSCTSIPKTNRQIRKRPPCALKLLAPKSFPEILHRLAYIFIIKIKCHNLPQFHLFLQKVTCFSKQSSINWRWMGSYEDTKVLVYSFFVHCPKLRCWSTD